MTSLPSVTIDQLPQSVEAFLALQDQVARTPQGGAAMMIVALLLYTDDVALGHACLTLAVDQSRLSEGSHGHDGWQLRGTDRQLIRTQIGGQPHIPRSYLRGATPENGYRLPSPPYQLAFSANPYSGDAASGSYKVFVDCSGAASPRPVTVRRDGEGIWKAREWSSLLSGIRKPAPEADL
jgi:hypothetical protein